MSFPSLPRPIAGGLQSPGALATLMLPGRRNVFGTATIGTRLNDATELGEFSPLASSAGISRKEDASLLIPSLNVVLRVQVWPRETHGGAEQLHFEWAGWSYLNGSPAPGPN